MKKIFYFFVVLIISVSSLIGCSADNTNQDNTNPVNNQTIYTKEFLYLPSYNGIESTVYTPATTEDPFAEAEYLIDNAKNVQVYNDYKAILEKDGWTITEEIPVSKFSANKDTHIANITVMIFNNDVLLNVRSK